MSKFRRDEPRIRESSKGSKDRYSKFRGDINRQLEEEQDENSDYLWIEAEPYDDEDEDRPW